MDNSSAVVLVHTSRILLLVDLLVVEVVVIDGDINDVVVVADAARGVVCWVNGSWLFFEQASSSGCCTTSGCCGSSEEDDGTMEDVDDADERQRACNLLVKTRDRQGNDRTS
jgi:hypothetical protein